MVVLHVKYTDWYTYVYKRVARLYQPCRNHLLIYNLVTTLLQPRNWLAGVTNPGLKSQKLINLDVHTGNKGISPNLLFPGLSYPGVHYYSKIALCIMRDHNHCLHDVISIFCMD